MRNLRIVLTVLLLFAVATIGIASADEAKSITIDVPSSAAINKVTTIPVTIHGGENIFSFLITVPNSVTGTTITIRAPEGETSGTYTITSSEDKPEQKILWFTPSEGISGTRTLFLIDVLPTDASPSTIPLTIEVDNQMYNEDYVEVHADYAVTPVGLSIDPSPQVPEGGEETDPEQPDIDDPTVPGQPDDDDPADPEQPDVNDPTVPKVYYVDIPTDIPEGSILVDVNNPTSTLIVGENGVIGHANGMVPWTMFGKNYKVEGETNGQLYQIVLPSSSFELTDSNGNSDTFVLGVSRDLGLTFTTIPLIDGYYPKELVLTHKVKDMMDDMMGIDTLEVVIPLVDGTYTIANLEESDLVSGDWEIYGRYDEDTFPSLGTEAFEELLGVLTVAPSVTAGSTDRTDLWTETWNANTPALVGIDIKPEDLYTLLTRPVIEINGLSVVLAEDIYIRTYQKFEEPYTFWTTSIMEYVEWDEEMDIINTHSLSLSDMDALTVYFEGRVLGDTTGDGMVTEDDYTNIAESLVGLDTLTDKELFYSDVSGDGIVDALDIIMMAQMQEGILDENYA